eukprot:TRINITY_DN26940_c0_g1_i1.p1 TRINITY_DN26940_c0_g1~~TRINITY_DN26940_c0_g1_i1.p1  ORF type:complete len:383 (-),score=67.68 TRINITY_DN26940_c0_g1_i1:46-1194(-)
MRSGWRAAAVLAAALVLAPSLAAAHYGQAPCGADEAQGEVQGGLGYLCAPKCDQNFNCPTDIPYGSSAQAQCMLKDVDQSAFCGLLCQMDSQCPSGATCQQLRQVQIGLCQFPISAADWARSTVTRKFAVGWPKQSTGPGAFQIAKTYASLQTLKSKYNIDDGDTDMVTLKEFLSALSGTSSVSTTLPATAGSMLNSIWGPALAPPATPIASASGVVSAAASPGVAAAASPSQNAGSWDFASGKWTKDAQYFENNVLFGGVPGIEKEVHDTIWNLEHLEKRGVASKMLRSMIMLGVAYLCIGALIKSQTTGARGVDMIPHIGFWMEYPALVSDGIEYAKILCGAVMGQPIPKHDGLSGGLSGTPIGRGGAGSRGGVGSFDAL